MMSALGIQKYDMIANQLFKTYQSTIILGIKF